MAFLDKVGLAGATDAENLASFDTLSSHTGLSPSPRTLPGKMIS